MHPCKVCIELDGDRTLKADIKFCGMCGTWICSECEPNLLRRGMAMGIIKARKLAAWKKAQERKKAVK
jgi:hypothetical protein